MRTDLFYGIEAEGRWRGLRTLFVPAAWLVDDAQALQIFDRVKERPVPHIYFGAGDCVIRAPREISTALFVAHKISPDACITFELAPAMLNETLPGCLSDPRFRVMVAFRAAAPAALAANMEVKIVSEQCVSVYQHQHTADLTYLKDVSLCRPN